MLPRPFVHRIVQFRCQGITQKRAYNIQNTEKVWSQAKFITYVYVTIWPVLYADNININCLLFINCLILD